MNSNGKRQKASSYQKFYSKCSFTGRTGKKDRYGSGRHEGFDLAGTGDERQVYKNDKLTFISDDMLSSLGVISAAKCTMRGPSIPEGVN